jgi:hypothetical protein
MEVEMDQETFSAIVTSLVAIASWEFSKAVGRAIDRWRGRK